MNIKGVNHFAALHECCEVNREGWGMDNVMSQGDFINKENWSKIALAEAVIKRLERGEKVYIRADVNVCNLKYIHSCLWIGENGVLMAKTGGRTYSKPYGPKPVRKAWMCSGCGMDRTINVIAAVYQGREPTQRDLDEAFEHTYALL